MDKFSQEIIENKTAMKHKPDILKKWLYFEKQYEVIKTREQYILDQILLRNPDLNSLLQN